MPYGSSGRSSKRNSACKRRRNCKQSEVQRHVRSVFMNDRDTRNVTANKTKVMRIHIAILCPMVSTCTPKKYTARNSESVTLQQSILRKILCNQFVPLLHITVSRLTVGMAAQAPAISRIHCMEGPDSATRGF